MGLLSDYLSSQRSEQAAAKGRQFAADMSNTAWQRGMEDMRLAGMNPILAYKTGPASSPVAAIASAPSSGDTLGTGVRAGEALTKKATGKSTRTMLASQAEQMASGAAVNRATAGKVMADTIHVGEQTRNTRAQASISESNAVKAALEARFYSTGRGKFNYELNRWMDPAAKALGGIGAAIFGKKFLGNKKGRRPGRTSPGYNAGSSLQRKRRGPAGLNLQ